MPFTPTHIVAVLPIRISCKYLSFSALIIGSMIPDFPMFFPLASYHFSHSLLGLFAYCLPCGLLFYFLWELFGKNLAISLLPFWIRCRLKEFRSYKFTVNWQQLLLLGLAIIIGSITHIIWDAFTHQERWGVNLFPLLNKEFSFSYLVVPGYKLFQYGSTLIGLPLLFILGLLSLQKIPPNSQKIDTFLSQSTKWLIAISFIALNIAIAFYYWFSFESLSIYLYQVLTKSISASLILFFLYGIIYRIWLVNSKLVS